MARVMEEGEGRRTCSHHSSVEGPGLCAEPRGTADTQLLGQIGRHDAAPADSVAEEDRDYSAGTLIKSTRSIWSDVDSIIVVPTDCLSTSFPHDCAIHAALRCGDTDVYGARSMNRSDCPGTFDQSESIIRNIYVALAISTTARQGLTTGELMLDSPSSRV